MAKSTAELLERASAGFAPIKVDEAVKQSAAKHLEDWLDHPKFASLVREEPRAITAR